MPSAIAEQIRASLNAFRDAPPPASIEESRARLEALVSQTPPLPDRQVEVVDVDGGVQGDRLTFGGAGRGILESLLLRLRELGSPGLLLSGDPGEGPLLGSYRSGVQPPGRGLLVRRRERPSLVQVALSSGASDGPKDPSTPSAKV